MFHVQWSNRLMDFRVIFIIVKRCLVLHQESFKLDRKLLAHYQLPTFIAYKNELTFCFFRFIVWKIIYFYSGQTLALWTTNYTWIPEKPNGTKISKLYSVINYCSCDNFSFHFKIYRLFGNCSKFPAISCIN